MLQLPKLADCRLSNVLIESTQRESNPHDQHGKLVGCRYIMGAPSVGPEGLEPSRHGLRDRYAAASTLVPSVGSEGFEPSPHRLKGEYAAVTPRPRRDAGVTFLSPQSCHEETSLSVVRGGIAPATGGVSDRYAALTTPDQRTQPQWAGRRSNPRIRLFRPALLHLSYRPNEKGQVSWMTPGLCDLRECFRMSSVRTFRLFLATANTGRLPEWHR